MKIGIVVLGAGRWGVNLIRNFLQHPDSEVLAIVDPNPNSLVSVQKQFNLNASVILASDWFQVQELPGLEAVAIATPASTHYTIAAAALKGGYHVLVEKPLTLNLGEAIELCQLAETQQRQLFVDHTYLFHPAVDRGQAIIQQNQLGKLRYGYAQRTHLEPVRHDVDALWDLAIHDIAIFNTWLQQTPIKVSAIGTVFRKEEGRGKREAGINKKEIQNPLSPTIFALNPLEGLADLVWVTLTYPDEFQVFIHLCWLNPDKQRRLTVVGSLGTLIFDEMSLETPLSIQQVNSDLRWEENCVENSIKPQKSSVVERKILSLEAAEPLRKVCDRFLKCVQTNTPCSISSGSASVELIRILCALSKSLELGGKTVNR
jgi:predicted dehydrogenase